jgi:tRNA pseudouridine38-40 synthase
MYQDHSDQDHSGQNRSDQDVLDQDVLDQDVLDQDVLDQDVLDQDVLDQDILDQNPIPYFRPPVGYRRIYLELAWHGAGFRGWQSQAMGERTVQDVLFAALEGYGVAQRPVASGRTDAGVHAYCMAAHVDLAHDYPIAAPKLARALSFKLPPNLQVLRSLEAPTGFHARHSCLWREYCYQIDTHAQPHPLERDRALWFPYPLELEAMQQAAQLMVGEHNFSAFASQEERQPIRRLLSLEWSQSPGRLELRLRGRSFLRHMVRAIVGTLLKVGEGKMSQPYLEGLLLGGTRGQAGRNVPAHGLHFWQAHYPHLDPHLDPHLEVQTQPDLQDLSTVQKKSER